MEVAVKGHGIGSAKIMFVGDYPTTADLSTGYALTQFSESYIDEQLRQHGMRIKEVYRTLYIKEPMKGYESSKKRAKELITELQQTERLDQYKKILANEIYSIQPNVIVPLGELAMNYIAAERNIDKFRGSVLPISPSLSVALNNEKKLYEQFKVIPTWHPREIVRSVEKKPISSLDFGKIVSYKNLSGPLGNKYVIWVCRTANAFNDFLARHPNPPFGTFDIETHHGFITCIGFSFDGIEAVSVPLLEDTMPILERIFLYRRIARLLRASSYQWVNQNILYDLTVEERYGFYVKNIVGDTMLAAHTLYVEMLKGLDFLTSIYTDIPYYKDEGKEFDPKLGHSMDQLYIYNAKDALATWQVWKAQLDEFDERPLSKAFYFNLNSLEQFENRCEAGYNCENGAIKPVPQGVMPLFHFYRRVQKRGIRIDETKRKSLQDKYEKILQGYESDISSTLGKQLNVRSPKQVKDVVYSELGCPEIWATNRETGEKRLDTGREALEEICFNKLNPNSIEDAGKISILKKIIYARKVYKIVKYLQLPIHPDGRIRTVYKIAGTKSGRTSGASTIDKLLVLGDNDKVFTLPENKKQGLGTSFQTVPKHGFIDDEATDGFDVVKLGDDIMEIFVPSPGYCFMDGDKSQAEARIVAILAEDYDILEAFDRPNSYIHRLTSSWIYQCSPDDIKKKTNEYEMGKRGRHGCNYDMQPFRFSRMCHIHFNEAAIILMRIHEHSPKIRGVFHAKVREELSKRRLLINPYGRRRDFFGRIDDNAFKDGYSWIPQGTCSDHTKFAALRIDAACHDMSIDQFCLMEIHDNVVAEVNINRRERYAEVYKREMEKPTSFREIGTFIRDYELVIPVELGCGMENLGHMEDFKV